jgi:hypothetical protein
MPTLAPVPDTFQVEVNYSYQTIPCQNVLAFKRIGGPIAVGDAEALAEEVDVAWVTYIMPRVVATLAMTHVYVKSLDPASPYEFDRTTTGAGTFAGNGAPINVASMTQFISGLIGRSYKGRMYLPAVPEGVVEARTLDPVWVTATQLAITNAMGDLFGAGFQHSVVSRMIGGVPRVTGLAVPIVAYATSPIIADMGRRINN